VPQHVRLVVEGPSDEALVQALLLRAGLPLDNCEVVSAGGRDRAAWVASLVQRDEQAAILVDTDGEDAEIVREQILRRVPSLRGRVFVATPNIEAWILDDEALARGVSRTRAELSRLTTNPRGEDDLDLLTLASLLDVDRSAARNPTLREFLLGMSALLGAPIERFHADSAGRSLSRDVIAGLLREVSPSEVVWKPSAGGTPLTAKAMLEQVQAGTELGRQYASDLLRVSRDLLQRKAKKQQ